MRTLIKPSFSLLAAATLLAGIAPHALVAHGESLFRGGVNYSASTPYTPHSLFSQPIPAAVGDIITITIDEQSQMQNSAELTVERQQNISENSSGLMNRIIHKLGIPQRWSFPDLNGLDTDNQLESTAQALRTSQLRDTITCQVVQVLPNGNLVVQGTKSVLINKDRVDMIVTGIVNPYYLNQNNTIASTQVANFQMLMGGKGVITRQQNDGLYNKIYQFFQ
jgi:flagellar L-ring protein FlgH